MWVPWLMDVGNSSGLSAFSASCRYSPQHVKPLAIEATYPHSSFAVRSNRCDRRYIDASTCGRAPGFAPLTDEAGVYLPTGPGDAQRMELLSMPGDGSDVWLDVRTVQLYLQISLTSIYKLIHQGDIPAVKLGTKTIRVNRKALEEYLQRAQLNLKLPHFR